MPNGDCVIGREQNQNKNLNRENAAQNSAIENKWQADSINGWLLVTLGAVVNLIMLAAAEPEQRMQRSELVWEYFSGIMVSPCRHEGR